MKTQHDIEGEGLRVNYFQNKSFLTSPSPQSSSSNSSTTRRHSDVIVARFVARPQRPSPIIAITHPLTIFSGSERSKVRGKHNQLRRTNMNVMHSNRDLSVLRQQRHLLPADKRQRHQIFVCSRRLQRHTDTDAPTCRDQER